MKGKSLKKVLAVAVIVAAAIIALSAKVVVCWAMSLLSGVPAGLSLLSVSLGLGFVFCSGLASVEYLFTNI